MKENLKKRSLDAGQRAIHHYLQTEYDQFLMQAAMCFELLGKSRLATIHPSLIVDKDFDSFLHVCAEGKHSKRAPWNIKTINATEVLKRCIQLHPALTDFKDRLGMLAEFRNSAIHLGEVIEDERKEIFHEFIASTCLIIEEMGIPRKDFFGRFADLVETHLNTSLTEVSRLVAEKIARSKSNFERKYGMLNNVHREDLIGHEEDEYDLEKYEEQFATCPACGKKSVLSGSTDVDWDVDFYPDGTVMGATPIVTLTPSTFSCRVCGLALEGSAELQAAGFSKTLPVDDVDPADFYDERDYDRYG